MHGGCDQNNRCALQNAQSAGFGPDRPARVRPLTVNPLGGDLFIAAQTPRTSSFCFPRPLRARWTMLMWGKTKVVWVDGGFFKPLTNGVSESQTDPYATSTEP